jgi:hypothetical protein
MSITEDCIYCKDRGLCSRIQKRIDELKGQKASIQAELLRDKITAWVPPELNEIIAVIKELEGLLPPKGDSRREKPEGLSEAKSSTGLKSSEGGLGESIGLILVW